MSPKNNGNQNDQKSGRPSKYFHNIFGFGHSLTNFATITHKTIFARQLGKVTNFLKHSDYWKRYAPNVITTVANKKFSRYCASSSSSSIFR